MRISSKTEYGIRALVHLAECGGGQPYCIQDIADNEGISYTFLEKIFSRLRKAGIVSSHRGVNGGYMLAKDVSKISLKDIIETLEGKIEPFKSLVEQKKSPKVHCKSHLILAVTQRKIIDSLDSLYLNDLVSKN